LLFFSPAIQAEVDAVLKEKFGWEPREIKRFALRLWDFGTSIEPRVSLKVIVDDPDDDRVLECAIAAAHAIISGDRHLLRLKSFQSIPIQSPRQFLDSKAWE